MERCQHCGGSGEIPGPNRQSLTETEMQQWTQIVASLRTIVQQWMQPGTVRAGIINGLSTWASQHVLESGCGGAVDAPAPELAPETKPWKMPSEAEWMKRFSRTPDDASVTALLACLLWHATKKG